MEETPPPIDPTLQSQTPRRSRRILQKLIAFVLLVAAALSLLSMYDLRIWWMELAAHFRFHAIVMFAIASILAAIRPARNWRVLVIAVIGLLFNCLDVIWHAPPSASISKSDAALRVIQFNVGNRDGSWASVIQWLEAQQADVIFLQETRPTFAAELEKSSLASHIVLRNVRPDSRGTIAIVMNNATKSKADLNEKLFEKTDRQLAELTVRVGGKMRKLLSVHMCRPTDAAEYEKQTDEIMKLGSWLTGSGGDRIAIGDCNCTPYSPRFYGMLGLNEREFGNAGTWPAVVPSVFGIATDAVIAGKFDHIESATAGPNLGSDHRPLMVTFRLVR